MYVLYTKVLRSGTWTTSASDTACCTDWTKTNRQLWLGITFLCMKRSTPNMAEQIFTYLLLSMSNFRSLSQKLLKLVGAERFALRLPHHPSTVNLFFVCNLYHDSIYWWIKYHRYIVFRFIVCYRPARLFQSIICTVNLVSYRGLGAFVKLAYRPILPYITSSQIIQI